MNVRFNSSNSPSIGVEIELQLLESSSLEIANKVNSLLKEISNNPLVQEEFIENCIEINSPPSKNVDELEKSILPILKNINNKSKKLDVVLCGAATHPFNIKEATITSKPRYIKSAAEAYYTSHNQITYAMHVHVGMPSGEETIRVMGYLRNSLPAFIALAANSPFFHGVNSSFASFRQRVLVASRTYGIPPSFDKWSEFQNFYSTFMEAKVWGSLKDIHWDILPRPDLGTLEIRAMDVQSTLEEAMAITAFVQCFIVYLIENTNLEIENRLPCNLPQWIEKENYYQAARLGLNARFIFNSSGGSILIKELIQIIRDSMKPIVTRYGYEKRLLVLQNKRGYEKQLDTFNSTGSLKKVLKKMVNDLEDELM